MSGVEDGYQRLMTIPKVVLIGGPPFVGKSAAARCFASRYGYGCISSDDIGKAIGVVTTVQTHPGLHTVDDTDYQEYFTVTSVDALIDHARRSHGIIWPALEKIIRTHSTWGDPLVMEGYALWPEQVMATDFASTGAVWLACDDQLLEARIRSQTSFYRGASDEEALIANFLRRSSRYNELMVESAMEYGATVISVEIGHSVEDVADLCVSALAEE
jgi:2-phosphoglycerate kinase